MISRSTALPARCIGAALRLLMLLLCVSVLTGCGLFGGDEEEDLPAELVKFKPTLKIRKAWSAGIGDDSEYLRLALAPATDGSTVYAASPDGKVAAFDAASGKRRWSVKTKLPLASGPAVGEGMLVVGSGNGEVIMLSADTGQERWRVNVSSELLAPAAVTRKLIFLRTVDGKLMALRSEDGSEAWFVQQSVPRLSVRGTGAPVAAGNMVLAGFDNGKLAAYEIATGEPLWETLITPPSGRTEVDRLVDINATVQVDGGDIYTAGYQGSIASVALESGQVLWARDGSSANGLDTDFINVYVSGADGELIAFARRSGREMWRTTLLEFRDLSGPAAWQNSVVVGDFEGYVHWLNATSGVIEARMRAGSDRIGAPPLVVNDRIYVQTDGGKIYAFEARASK